MDKIHSEFKKIDTIVSNSKRVKIQNEGVADHQLTTVFTFRNKFTDVASKHSNELNYKKQLLKVDQKEVKSLQYSKVQTEESVKANKGDYEYWKIKNEELAKGPSKIEILQKREQETCFIIKLEMLRNILKYWTCRPVINCEGNPQTYNPPDQNIKPPGESDLFVKTKEHIEFLASLSQKKINFTSLQGGGDTGKKSKGALS